MILEKDRNIAFFTHLSGFGSYFFPMGSILFPFIIREMKKNDSKFMDDLTKDVVNFNLSYLLYSFVLKLLVVPFYVGSFFENFFTYHNNGIYIDFNSDDFLGNGFFLSILIVIKFVLIIKASISANKGEYYKYPYTIEFIK